MATCTKPVARVFRHLLRRFYSSDARTVASLLSLDKPVKGVHLQGWARKVHKKGKLLFVHINDGFTSDVLQVVVPRNVCRSVNVGSTVEVVGDWVKSEGSLQEMEIFATDFAVVGQNVSGKVIDDDASLPRNELHLRLKSSSFSDVLRLRSRLYTLTHQFFAHENFIHVDPPALSTNDCEGAGETFTVDAQGREKFFGDEEVFLPVSSQLHLEAVISNVPKVYTIGAAFRAEKSLSRQHLAEFRMLEAEFAFVHNVEQVCKLVERYIRYVVDSLRGDSLAMSRYNQVRQIFGEQGSDEPLITSMTDKSFPYLQYAEAEALLQRKGELVSDGGFNKQQEFTLVKHCEGPLFVTHHPSAQKPFYMSRTDDGRYAKCFDLLTGFVGELAGGSLRETNVDQLRARGCGTLLDWYIDLRERGQPPSGGFGIGVERFMQALFAIVNIRDTVAFPRWFKHCQC